jgi:hypothetical protein
VLKNMSGRTSDKRKSLYISDLPPPIFGYNAVADRPLEAVGAVGGNNMDAIISLLIIVLYCFTRCPEYYGQRRCKGTARVEK